VAVGITKVGLGIGEGVGTGVGRSVGVCAGVGMAAGWTEGSGDGVDVSGSTIGDAVVGDSVELGGKLAAQARRLGVIVDVAMALRICRRVMRRGIVPRWSPG
jgi:hypothetical protein